MPKSIMMPMYFCICASCGGGFASPAVLDAGVVLVRVQC